MELLLILLGAITVLELCRREFLFSTRRGRKGEREESKCGKDELLNLGVTFLIVYILIKMLGVPAPEPSAKRPGS